MLLQRNLTAFYHKRALGKPSFSHRKIDFSCCFGVNDINLKLHDQLETRVGTPVMKIKIIGKLFGLTSNLTR